MAATDLRIKWQEFRERTRLISRTRFAPLWTIPHVCDLSIDYFRKPLSFQEMRSLGSLSRPSPESGEHLMICVLFDRPASDNSRWWDFQTHQSEVAHDAPHCNLYAVFQ
jgi:hypothetical protein